MKSILLVSAISVVCSGAMQATRRRKAQPTPQPTTQYPAQYPAPYPAPYPAQYPAQYLAPLSAERREFLAGIIEQKREEDPDGQHEIPGPGDPNYELLIGILNALGDPDKVWKTFVGYLPEKSVSIGKYLEIIGKLSETKGRVTIDALRNMNPTQTREVLGLAKATIEGMYKDASKQKLRESRKVIEMNTAILGQMVDAIGVLRLLKTNAEFDEMVHNFQGILLQMFHELDRQRNYIESLSRARLDPQLGDLRGQHRETLANNYDACRLLYERLMRFGNELSVNPVISSDEYFRMFEEVISPMLAVETDINALGIMTRPFDENFLPRWKESRLRRRLSADVFNTVSSDVEFLIP
jgi:hypothetical protein